MNARGCEELLTVAALFAMAILTAIALVALGSGCHSIQTKPAPEFPAPLTWLGIDVHGWAKTATLKASVSSDGKRVGISCDKLAVWKGKDGVDGACNANIWIIAKRNGQWYATTWEWVKPDTKIKIIKGDFGGYVQYSNVFPRNWNPAHGEKIGMFLSGLCRDKRRNVSERSNIVWIEWP